MGAAFSRLGNGMARARFRLRQALRGFRVPVAERLLIAPQELVAGDPSQAISFYSGHLMFAGRTVQTRGQSPFLVAAPTAAWLHELHGFAWLRHFRDADNPVVRHHARALVDEWLTLRLADKDPSVRHPAVAAQRMIAWLVNSPLLLTDANHAFYNRFMRSLARNAQWLDYCAGRRSLGPVRVAAAIAYANYTLCALTGENDWKRASRLLAAALADEILADGCPVSRNPADAQRFAEALLPLRTAYTARGRPPPAELQQAIDRLLGFLRLIRHPEGSLALFNGMGSSHFALLGAILAFDANHAGAPAKPQFGGYQRMERGGAVVIVDAGAAPPASAALEAHAGALSFEFSTGRERMVVNCGAAPAGLDDLHEALRETAAHATLSLDGASSARFRPFRDSDGAWRRRLSDPGERPKVERDSVEAGEALAMRSDGYRKSHGLAHHRALVLDASGERLSGSDLLETVGRGAAAAQAHLRFHLHPRVTAAVLSDRTSIRLDIADGSIWTFEAGGLAVSLEESLFMGGLSSQRRAEQIVVAVTPGEEIRWSFVRRAPPRS